MFGSVMNLYLGRDVDYVAVMTDKPRNVKMLTSTFTSDPYEETEE